MRKQIAESPPRSPLSNQGHRQPRSKRFLTPADIADIKHQYGAGQTTQQIGTRYSISKTRVATVLREQGVVIRRQGLTAEQISEAAGHYVSGKSLSWLAARYDVSPMTVSQALRRQGVQLRPRPGWR